jgi:hypothetical protein
MPPTQPGLFPNEPASGSELLRIDKGKARLSPAQRKFNELTGQIARARADLAAWQDHGRRVDGRVVNELLPLEAQMRQAQRKLIVLIDQLLCDPKPSPKLRGAQRDALLDLLVELCGFLLQHGPDPEIEALHDRHAEMSLAEQRAEDEQIDLEITESVISDMYGADVLAAVQAEGGDADDMLLRAQAYVRERDRAELSAAQAGIDASSDEPPRERTARERRAEQSAERKRAEAREASESVREVYRRLVRQLHPDREPDPVQRERKTGLMQQINRAHAEGDLLTLLTLQMEVEQLSADELAELPAQRLAHFNRVLNEQWQLLKEEIRNCIDALQIGLADDGPRRLSRPRELDALFESRLREIRQIHKRNEEILARLSDSKLRRACLDELARDWKLFQRVQAEEDRELDSLIDELEAFHAGYGDRDLDDFPFADDFDPFAAPRSPHLHGGPSQSAGSKSKKKRKKRRKR